MSRSGYTDAGDIDNWDLIRWRGAVASAIRGRNGQVFLREMLAALYALPEKRLIENNLIDEYDGAVCVLGAVGRARSIDMGNVDPEDHELVAKLFSIPHTLACEIMAANDQSDWHEIAGADAPIGMRQWRKETPEERWLRVRHWVVDHIK